MTSTDSDRPSVAARIYITKLLPLSGSRRGWTRIAQGKPQMVRHYGHEAVPKEVPDTSIDIFIADNWLGSSPHPWTNIWHIDIHRHDEKWLALAIIIIIPDGQPQAIATEDFASATGQHFLKNLIMLESDS